MITETQMMRIAPSVFATHAAEDVSDRYTFIPTIDIVRGLQKAEFYPVKVSQTRSRDEEKKGFARHMIRFRKTGVGYNTGMFPEIVLMNSHDRSSCYQLRCGIYRMVCSNGLVVGNDYFSKKVRHSGNILGNVIEAACELIETTPQIVEKAIEWKGVNLSEEQRKVFAECASTLRWDASEVENGKDSAMVRNLLQPKRYEDRATDLWTTFNVVQEHVIRGGVNYKTKDGEYKKSKKVSSIKEDFRLNTALWNLTEKMAELAK